MQEDQKGEIDEKNLGIIEKLSEDLEQLYKELELYQKENNLLENYLFRTLNIKLEDLPEENGKFSELTLDQKYEIAISEEQYLKDQIEDGKKNSETMIENLKAVIEEREHTIKELRKEALEFQRNVLINKENQKLGKIDANRLIKFREVKIEEKEIALHKMDEKKINLENKIRKLQKQLKKKIIGNDNLKFIDFHQLQIENKKFMNELDEKNIKLQDLKIMTGEILDKLNKVKEMLNNQLISKEKYQTDIQMKKIQISNVNKETKDIQNSITSIQKTNDKLTLQKSKMEDNKDLKMKISNFIQDKDQEKNLIYQIKNLKRKHEVIDFQYQRALKFLQNNKTSLPKLGIQLITFKINLLYKLRT